MTSDNGAVGRQCKSKEFNSPLKGFKGSLYDGALRVRCYVKYPRESIEKGKMPIKAPVHITDLYPTLLSLANIKSVIPTDGIDISDQLRGSKMAERVVTQDLVPNVRYAAKMNNYKLCGNCNTSITNLEPRAIEWELFDIQKDPQEKINLLNKGIREEAIMKNHLIEQQNYYKEPHINSIFADWKKPVSCLGCYLN